MKKTRHFAVSVFVLALVSNGFAQQTTATLTGIVTDSSGAPVGNVRVKATSVRTNTIRETTTNDAGSYSLPFLAAGEPPVGRPRTG